MKSKRFSEEQIIAVLKQAEAGAKTKELCRRHGISEATFYNWKAKYAGMTVSEVRRLKELEAENSKLKRLLAEAELEKAAFNGVSIGKGHLAEAKAAINPAAGARGAFQRGSVADHESAAKAVETKPE